MYDVQFKIVVLGDADEHSKTAFIGRYVTRHYTRNYKLSTGADIQIKVIDLDGKKIILQIWDIGREERFRYFLPTYCLGANAAILLYNITDPSTLEHIADWIRVVRKEAGDIPIILVGVKAHLEQSRAISKEEGILAAKKYNLSGFVEVSAKTGHNIEKAFELITAKLLEKYSTTKTSEKHIREDHKVTKTSEKHIRADPKVAFEELIRIYNSYKKGEYTFGKYSTKYDLGQAFFEGKVFVLKGSNVLIYACLMLLFMPVCFFFFLSLGFSILLFAIEVPLIVFSIIIKRRFVVIGPSGVYYRRYFKKDFFLWMDVSTPIMDFPILVKKFPFLFESFKSGPYTTITIITPNNKKLRFLHGHYKKKEFPSSVEEEMFLRLFQIYSILGKRQRTKVLERIKDSRMEIGLFKIILFGDNFPERTDFTQRFLPHFFLSELTMNIGVDYYSKTTSYKGKKVKLQIWDFGGEERFRFLLPTNVRGTRGGLFLYDIANYSSLAHIDDWLSVIRKEIKDSFPILVVGIIPREKKNREVSSADGIKIAKSRNVNGFIECNPKTGENVETMFEELTKLMMKNQAFEPSIKKNEDKQRVSTGEKKVEFLNRSLLREREVDKGIIRRFEEREGIPGVIICDSSGLPIQYNVDFEINEEILPGFVISLIKKAKELIEALKVGGLKFIRLETSKGETMIALEEQLILIILK